MPLQNAGWRETPAWVQAHCLACRRHIGPHDRVYCPNMADPWNGYCAECGVKAEAVVKRKLAEATMAEK